MMMSETKTKKKITSLKDFNTKWKSNVVDKPRQAGTRGFWKTGSRAVDKMLGGGFPKSEIVELAGSPASGKSSIALKCASMRLKEGGAVAYFDLERGLDFASEESFVQLRNGEWIVNPDALASGPEYDEAQKGWLRKNGIDPFNENFQVYKVDHGEQMFQMIVDIIASKLFDLVIVDSIAAMLTRSQMDGEPGEAGFGAVAKLLGVELARITRLLDKYPEAETTVLLINQTRDKIGYMSNGGTKSFGGRALEFFVGTKLKFSRVGRKKKGNEVVTETRVQVDKSRHAAATECRIYISSERGVDTMAELIDVGISAGVIHTSGNWHYLYQDPVEADMFEAAKKVETIPGFLAKINGETAVLAWLTEHGWEDRLQSLATVSQPLADSTEED